MTIVFLKDELLFELFPYIKKDESNLLEVLKEFYTVGSEIPKVEIKNSTITIELDLSRVNHEQGQSKKVINLCEDGRFTEALPLAVKLTQDYPSASDYHRILGQIQSELGDQDEAVNSLIDALKWNPNNEYALIMMGNIFARFKEDIDTALVYYNQVIKNNPNESLAYNNIAANLMQLGKIKEAKSYFHQALEIDPDYPNTNFGLAMISMSEGKNTLANEFILKCISKNPTNNDLYKNSISLALELSTKLSEQEKTKKTVDEAIRDLEERFNTVIKIESSDTIQTAAKIEFKENYDRDFHLIKYQSKYPTYPHLILHELMHLELAEYARKLNENQLFITNSSHEAKFFQSLDKYVKKLKGIGISEDNVSLYLKALFSGINNQVFNTPIDLFIEDMIYNRFSELRIIQFSSLFGLVSEGIEAITNKDIVNRSPKGIIGVSKIYNLVNAIHFKTLYGVDLIKRHNPSKIEKETAERFYSEFLEYREDKEAGEEYELVQHWAEDLKLDGYFDLISETKYRNQSIDDVMAEVNLDPFNLDDDDPSKERKMRSFIKNHSKEELNLPVAMYMVGALEFYRNMTKDQVKKIAFEFATLGMSGIDPEKDNYEVPSIPNKKFTGYKALAFYYTSWALGIPEMLSQLQMPFDKEYEVANSFLKQ
ncbi:tetratricopeptide repeat protein [Maribacter luteus]|uniref:tetratricopeptide repeat protein n=1 Tax=Maribacter luteus TaxID=2594478 RepID=UPI00249241D5|nr:tetratricopeptide repeat protein [Maribacter luteus]